MQCLEMKHGFKSKSLTSIMTKCINADYRIGCTGTLDGTQTHKLVLEGLFGKVYKSTTTKDLIDKKDIITFQNRIFGSSIYR